MKPCRKYRKQIAWLAAAALEAGETRALRAHLETCEACRGYLAEISRVTERLAAAETNPAIQASERFHGKVTGRLRAAKPESVGEILAASFRGRLLNWRVAVPLVAVLVLGGAALITWRQSSTVASLPQAGAPAPYRTAADVDLAPTIGNYETVASQSLDKLDDLLTRQGLRNLPPVPPLSASTLLSANPME